MPYIGNPIYQSAFVTDQFSGNGSTTAFTMSVAPAGVTNVLVVVSGVVQDPSTYGVVGNTLTFSAAPPSGTGNISCRYLGVPVTGITTTAYRTVTEFTATASQTTFTPPSYNVGFINVYLNGVLLGSADYTATNGTTVVLATGAAAGNLVTVESFLVSSVLNALPQTGGTLNGTLNITGNEYVGGSLGIGNTSPTGNLHVGNGTTTGDQNLYVQSDSANRPRLRLWGGTVNKLELSVGGTAEINAVSSTPMTFLTNNTERMRIDSSGYITTPYQPKFDASATANGSGSGEWGAAWAWNANINVGSHFNGNGRFTAPVAGTYLFYIEIIPTSAGGATRSRVRKNGADLYEFNGGGARQIRGEDSNNSFWGIWMVSLAVGDYVSGYSEQNTVRESAYSTFGGYLIG
jgi:hypothetical protein